MTNAFLTTLFTMTNAATVAAVAVMILRLPLKKAPRWITCALWLAVLVRMVCPVGISAPVSVTGQVTQRIPAPQAYEQVQAVTDPVVEPTPADPTPQTTQVVVPETSTLSAETVLFALWAAGAIAMAGWAVLSYLRLRYRVADAVRVQGKVYETDRVESPFLCGFIRPRIYLPVGVSDHDRHYVLLHEEAHLRRRDHLTKPLAWLALSLHWFNPVLWLAYWLYGRDVETACDQAVVSDFDRSDTAGYAAALLHLGRKTALPHAVPLAFGEENAKGRVKHVLDYKRPGFWVAGFALVVAVAAAFLLLSDNDASRHGPQLDGVTIVDVLPTRLDVALPEPMGRELVDLLNKHGHEAYTPYGEERVVISEETIYLWAMGGKGTIFYFEPTDLTLLRVNDDGYSARSKIAQVNESLRDDPDFVDWLARLDDLRAYGLADEFYATKTPYIGDPVAVEKVLGQVFFRFPNWDYTIQLHTDQKPYSVDVIFQTRPIFLSDQNAAADYLRSVAPLFLALVDNADEINFIFPIPGDTKTVSVQADPANKDLTQEEFRVLFAETPVGTLSVRDELSFHDTEPIYLDPDSHSYAAKHLVKDSCGVTLSKSFDTNGSFTVRFFNADTPDEDRDEVLENAVYQSTFDPQIITDKNGHVVLDMRGHDYTEVVTVLDQDGQPSGYVFYQVDGLYYAAHYTQPGQLEYLVEFNGYGFSYMPNAEERAALANALANAQAN